MVSLERWKTFDLRTQIGHIASELSRAEHWQKKHDDPARDESLYRALELADMTLNCCQGARRREMARYREGIASFTSSRNECGFSLDQLVQYGLTVATMKPETDRAIFCR